MSEEILVRYCSPTLAGMKTGNMFSCDAESEQALNRRVREWNQLLRKKGLRVLPLRFRNGRALIYVYRPARLWKDLQHNTALRLLESTGYSNGTPESCIRHLRKRISENEEFPHEVGLFLGYPPEDVRGFIEKREPVCKRADYWKIYSDPESSLRLFAKYRKCTDAYCKHHANGCPLEKLAIAG